MKALLFILLFFKGFVFYGQDLNHIESFDAYENLCKDTYTYDTIQGIAPIMLYDKDIVELGISQIEIRDSITANTKLSLYSIVVYFDKMGLLKGFNYFSPPDYKYAHNDNGFSVLVQRDENPFDIKLENESRDGFINPSLVLKEKYIISPTKYEDHLNILKEINVYPLFGKNAFVSFDTVQNKPIPNTVSYEHFYTEYSGHSYDNVPIYWYRIKKESSNDSTRIYVYLFEGESLDKSEIFCHNLINTITKDTVITDFYFYGVNPHGTYYVDRSGDICEDVIHHFNYFFHQDYIYNSTRFIGFIDEYTFRLRDIYSNYKGAYQSEDESIIKKSFKNKQATILKKENFLINNINGYDYLLNTFNNKEVLVKESFTDENGQYHPEEHKKVKDISPLNVLPNRIIIQVSLTDFWFIELTD